MGGTSSKLEESSKVDKKSDDGDARVGFIGKAEDGLRNVSNDLYEKEKERPRVRRSSRIPPRVPEASKGEQIAAGWPTWLAAVAGEAIEGWLPRRADTFEKIDKIGEGTYSNVYKARDMWNGKIVALKKVRFDNLEPESIRFMAREIIVLRRLDHPNVIKLEGLITSKMSCSLYLILEYMEHDLTGLVSLPGVKITEPQIKCYMHQLISGLEYCHSRGVLHRDIKSSNLLINDQGTLKIADFGLSTFFDNHQKLPLTSRVVTLWYRPPELLLGATQYGVAVDLWSTGCVLAELYAGVPVMPGRTEVEQLHKIFKLCGSPSDDYWRKAKLPHETIFRPQVRYRRCLAETFMDISPAALGLFETLLSIDPDDRGTASSALDSEFFTTEPFACDPSTLPKYPPSKEMNAKWEPSNREFVPKFQWDNYKSKKAQGSAAPIHEMVLLAQSMQGEEMHSSVPSYNVDQLLEEHDRLIQESAEKLRLEKRRGGKNQAQHRQTTVNPVSSSDGPSIVSVNKVDELLDEHDRQIQESTQRLRLEKKRAGKGKAQAKGIQIRG